MFLPRLMKYPIKKVLAEYNRALMAYDKCREP